MENNKEQLIVVDLFVKFDKKTNRFGYVDSDDNLVFGYQFLEAGPFNYFGIAEVKDEFGKFLINETGNEITEDDKNLFVCKGPKFYSYPQIQYEIYQREVEKAKEYRKTFNQNRTIQRNMKNIRKNYNDIIKSFNNDPTCILKNKGYDRTYLDSIDDENIIF